MTILVVIRMEENELRKKALEDLANGRYVIEVDLVEKELKKATPEYKKATPVKIGSDGTIIDGANRLSADPTWDIIIMPEEGIEAMIQRGRHEKNRKCTDKSTKSMAKTISEMKHRYQNEDAEKHQQWKTQRQGVAQFGKQRVGGDLIDHIAEDLHCNRDSIWRTLRKANKNASIKASASIKPAKKSIMECPACHKKFNSKTKEIIEEQPTESPKPLSTECQHLNKGIDPTNAKVYCKDCLEYNV